MDGVSVAASIVGIATAGVQISIKLVTLATQISTASDRVSSIGNDISLTSGVLHQLGELMTQKTTGDGISILNQDGLETTRTSAAMCERIFKEVEMEVKKASEQLRNYKPGQGRMRGEKIELSTTERAKWPFLQPKIDILRADLRDAKSTLMLVLQVASLALSKRMADTSISTSEHQDFVRAIVALELQRREERKDSTEQQAVSKSSGSNDKSNVWNADKIPPGEGTLKLDWKPQPSSSLAQAARKHTAEVKKSLKDSSDRQVRSLADPIVNYGVGQSRGLETESFMNLSLATSPGSNFRGTDGNSNVPKNHAIVSPHILLSSDSDSGTQTNHSTDLQLFLLKPIVKDLFDRIELRWSVQNTDLQPLAIREHMAKNEKHDLPSVVEMLQQLHAYGQAMVDSETSKDSGGSVVSLTRTKTDIRSRDMLFTGIPGLQFVIQRQIRQSPVWNPSHRMRSPVLDSSPRNPRLSRVAQSITTATSTADSHDSFDRSTSGTPSEAVTPSGPKETLMQKITRKTSSRNQPVLHHVDEARLSQVDSKRKIRRRSPASVFTFLKPFVEKGRASKNSASITDISSGQGLSTNSEEPVYEIGDDIEEGHVTQDWLPFAQTMPAEMALNTPKRRR